MADEGNMPANPVPNPAEGANGADNQPSAGFITQYMKDLSVENPKAPESFQWTDQPQLDVQFNIAAKDVGDGVHEVELKIVCTANAQAGAAYIIELAYCGLVGMRNMAEDQAHMFLYSEAPRMLFPFARRVVADAVHDAGFPPLMLDPIDFQGLYFQQLAAKRAREAEEGAGAPAADA